jgi:energy-coupling factor transporter ATP-binding protein EcfA2
VFGLGDKKYVKAVEDATFDVPKGSTLGIVGESGCGKSTLIRTIIGLEDSTAGDVKFMGLRRSSSTRGLSGRRFSSCHAMSRDACFDHPVATYGHLSRFPHKKKRFAQSHGALPTWHGGTPCIKEKDDDPWRKTLIRLRRQPAHLQIAKPPPITQRRRPLVAA